MGRYRGKNSTDWKYWYTYQLLNHIFKYPNKAKYSNEHCSFSNLSVTIPTSQLILQPFRCLTYVTVHSQTFLSLLLCHRLFTYVTWRAAHAPSTPLVVLNRVYTGMLSSAFINITIMKWNEKTGCVGKSDFNCVPY